jgi:hypothetical protein
MVKTLIEKCSEVCIICNKKINRFAQELELVCLQKPEGDYYINSLSIPIHKKCRYIKKE